MLKEPGSFEVCGTVACDQTWRVQMLFFYRFILYARECCMAKVMCALLKISAHY